MKPKPYGQAAAELVADLRFRQRAAKIHRLGTRPMIELLAEVAVRCDACDLLDEALDRYCALDARVLQRVGGDELPPLPIREVA